MFSKGFSLNVNLALDCIPSLTWFKTSHKMSGGMISGFNC